mmetsp:Transcript_26742/g.58997  ORF Transcript_26742/g.58997 Transcript_26742/m.58997 type:complete len:580 (+) Transcript_26742:61-1800(+)
MGDVWLQQCDWVRCSLWQSDGLESDALDWGLSGILLSKDHDVLDVVAFTNPSCFEESVLHVLRPASKPRKATSQMVLVHAQVLPADVAFVVLCATLHSTAPLSVCIEADDAEVWRGTVEWIIGDEPCAGLASLCREQSADGSGWLLRPLLSTEGETIVTAASEEQFASAPGLASALRHSAPVVLQDADFGYDDSPTRSSRGGSPLTKLRQQDHGEASQIAQLEARVALLQRQLETVDEREQDASAEIARLRIENAQQVDAIRLKDELQQQLVQADCARQMVQDELYETQQSYQTLQEQSAADNRKLHDAQAKIAALEDDMRRQTQASQRMSTAGQHQLAAKAAELSRLKEELDEAVKQSESRVEVALQQLSTSEAALDASKAEGDRMAAELQKKAASLAQAEAQCESLGAELEEAIARGQAGWREEMSALNQQMIEMQGIFASHLDLALQRVAASDARNRELQTAIRATIRSALAAQGSMGSMGLAPAAGAGVEQDDVPRQWYTHERGSDSACGPASSFRDAPLRPHRGGVQRETATDASGTVRRLARPRDRDRQPMSLAQEHSQLVSVMGRMDGPQFS